MCKYQINLSIASIRSSSSLIVTYASTFKCVASYKASMLGKSPTSDSLKLLPLSLNFLKLLPLSFNLLNTSTSSSKLTIKSMVNNSK